MATQAWHIYEKLQQAAAQLDAYVVADSSGLGAMWRNPRVSVHTDLSRREKKRTGNPNGILDNSTRFAVARTRLHNQRISLQQILENNRIQGNKYPLYITSEVITEVDKGAQVFDRQARWLYDQASQDGFANGHSAVTDDEYIETAKAYAGVASSRRLFSEMMPLIEAENDDDVTRSLCDYLSHLKLPTKEVWKKFSADGTEVTHKGHALHETNDLNIVAKALTIASDNVPVILFTADKDTVSLSMRGIDILSNPDQVYIAQPCRFSAQMYMQKAAEYEGVQPAVFAA